MKCVCNKCGKLLISKEVNKGLFKWFKNIYWKLDIYSCVYVPRNKPLFHDMEQSLNDFWAIIEEERIKSIIMKIYWIL